MSGYAVVTGASGGIGYEFAKLLAQDGYDLLIVARNREKLKQVQGTLEKKHGISVEIIAKDLSLSDNAQAVFDKVQKKHVDILINNAGFGDYGPFLDSSWEKEHAMMELNMVSLTLLTKRFAKKMQQQQSGRILNVASTAAFQPGPLMAVYFATKAYVLSLTEALADEFRESGITITALCPPATATGFQTEAHMESSELVKNRTHLMSASEVALSGYQALMKGQAIVVPGFINRLQIFAQRFLSRGFVVRMVHRRLR